MTVTPILQFGTSRFLQAHADLFVSEGLFAGNGSALGKISIVQSTNNISRARRLAALSSADGYPVKIRGLEEGKTIDKEVRVKSVARTLTTQDDWTEVCRVAVEEADIILSNTGDTGYNPCPEDLSPEFQQGKSYPAKLMHLLLARFQAHARPVQVMPMELIVENGVVLKERVLSIAEQIEPKNTPFIEYLKNDVIWVNSLVDRIVSEAIEPAGAVAEPYALWAIEEQPGLTLPCKHPAIQVVSDLEHTEALKLFILNLGHTYLVHRWHKSQAEDKHVVRDLMQDEQFLMDLKSLYQEEILPGFAAAGLAKQAEEYIKVTLDRFANPFLDHRLSDIYQNHAEKIQRRAVAFLQWTKSNSDTQSKPRLQALVDSLAD